MFLHEGPPQSSTEVVIENQPLEYFDGGGGIPPTISHNGNGILATAWEVAGPYVVKVLGLEAPAEPVAQDAKTLPTPEQVADILEAKHPVVSKIVPDLENGSARRDFNKANPHDASFDNEDPESLILHHTARNHGSIPVATLLELPSITRDDVLQLASVDNVREIIVQEDKEIFHAKQLSKGLAEYRKKKFPYLALLDAPDIDTFTGSQEYKDFLAAEEERAKADAIEVFSAD